MSAILHTKYTEMVTARYIGMAWSMGKWVCVGCVKGIGVGAVVDLCEMK